MMLCDTCFHANTCVNFCIGEGAYETTGCQYYDNAVHICDLLAAENDGRLVALPCKVGDTVYLPSKILSKIRAITVSQFYYLDGRWYARARDYNATEFEIFEWTIAFDDFGKTVFITREAAEAELGGEER